MAVYLLEETYELVDAIESDNPEAVCEELGDVLFHVLFMARMYEERGAFDLERTAERITAKMIRRHPHVFGTESADSAESVKRRWREIKRAEKGRADESVLASIPPNSPALMRAYRISERAAGTGFDWDDTGGVVQKAEEEWREFKSELKAAGEHSAGGRKGPSPNLALEFGDILFTLVNVARFAGIHPETALAGSTHKFEQRFRHMEKTAAEAGRPFETLAQPEMQRLWEAAKKSLDAPEDDDEAGPSTCESLSAGGPAKPH
jgi:tetrapyrrole methylase family protein/MazG family protein